MLPSNSTPFLDNSSILPPALFKKPERAWCAFFVQDTKMDMSGETMKTCEFGLGFGSLWTPKVWGDTNTPFDLAFKILNQRFPRIWLMATPEVIAENSKTGDSAVWPKVVKAIQSNRNNILGLRNPCEKLPGFPTPFNEKAPFNPHMMSTYYALGITPYSDLPADHFADITGKYPKQPRILMMDGGPLGPLHSVCNYKHLTRLVMNGTASAEQNPPFVIVETKYTPELASFLKSKFTTESKLVMKHVASSRGEGVVVIDATSETILDTQLKDLLSENAEFKNRNPLSICIIESFISTPEAPSLEKTKESLVRVANLVFQDNQKIEFYPVAAVRSFEDEKPLQEKLTRGMVKLGKMNDGRFVRFDQHQLDQIREKHFNEIATFAERAVSYDSDAAVSYFLSSNNHILNLIGIELFSPILSANYRESLKTQHGQSYKRIKESHCQLLISLLQRNKSVVIRERIWENILCREVKEMYLNPFFAVSSSFSALFDAIVPESESPKCRALLQQALIQNYINISFGFSPLPEMLKFTLDGLSRLNEIQAFSKSLRFPSCFNILQTGPLMMQREEGIDYFSALRQLEFTKIPKEVIHKMAEILAKKKDGKNFAFGFYRYFIRFQKEESGLKFNWKKEDWDQLLRVLSEQSVENATTFLWLLPEAFHIGWSAKMYIDLIKNYLRHQNAHNVVTFFGPIIRFLAQCKETKANMAHTFMNAAAQFTPDEEQYSLLLSKMQKLVLVDGMNINQVMMQVGQKLAQHIMAKGNSIESFEMFVSNLKG